MLKTSTPELARILGAGDVDAVFEPRFNIAPTTQVPVLLATGDGRRLISARWGLVPFWSKDGKSSYSMINARAETVATKPSFRQAYQKRRCAIPADGYYEWQKREGGKQPYYIAARDETPLTFAGLWERWQAKDSDDVVISCSIVTTRANADVDTIHDRMPVMLDQSTLEPWLTGPREAADELLHPAPVGQLAATVVSTYVNNARNEGERCITPLAVC